MLHLKNSKYEGFWNFYLCMLQRIKEKKVTFPQKNKELIKSKEKLLEILNSEFNSCLSVIRREESENPFPIKLSLEKAKKKKILKSGNGKLSPCNNADQWQNQSNLNSYSRGSMKIKGARGRTFLSFWNSASGRHKGRKSDLFSIHVRW